jgi:hypothetical protein
MQQGVNLLRQPTSQFLADNEAAIAQVATSRMMWSGSRNSTKPGSSKTVS